MRVVALIVYPLLQFEEVGPRSAGVVFQQEICADSFGMRNRICGSMVSLGRRTGSDCGLFIVEHRIIWVGPLGDEFHAMPRDYFDVQWKAVGIVDVHP